MVSNDMELDWHIRSTGWSTTGRFNASVDRVKSTFRATVPYDVYPAVCALVHVVAKHGFVPAQRIFEVIRTEITEVGKTAVSYSIDTTLKLKNGNAALYLTLRGDADTMALLPQQVTAHLKVVKWDGDIVDWGKGQIKRCRAIAMDLFRAHTAVFEMAPAMGVTVPSWTRGGRGGRNGAKVAVRSILRDELIRLQDGVTLVSIYSKLSMKIGNDFSGYVYRRKVTLLENGRLRLRGGWDLYPGVDKNCVWLCCDPQRERPAWRMELDEYNRLLVKRRDA